MFYVINKYASLFPPSLILSVISPVREICLSNRCLKYFDRVFVSVSSIKLMWWQADSKKRFAPNVLEPLFSSSTSHLKISFNVITLARALLKMSSLSRPGNHNLPSFWTDIPWQDALYGQDISILGSKRIAEGEICRWTWMRVSEQVRKNLCDTCYIPESQAQQVGLEIHLKNLSVYIKSKDTGA